MRTRMQTAQHDTTDVHTIVPGGVIQFVVDMGIRTTGKHDECRYQKELKERLFFHQGESAGHEMGKSTGYLNIPIPLMETDKYINMGISGTTWKTTLTPFQFHIE